jgi:prepilin-type N-terminal cleavage/methylation domain-containing protein
MRKEHRAFTLVELMIVVSLLGILSALVLPTFQGNATEAKESAAKSDLRAMRAQISLYKLHHNGAFPGYVGGVLQSVSVVTAQLVGTSASDGSYSASKSPAGIYVHGPYLMEIPVNPFNDLSTIAYSSDFAGDAGSVSSGWLYNAATGEIRLNKGDTDSSGRNYYDY